uniref:Uncharacterized protein n=1 Tax=Panagrolaimus sp. PS1159 TaxID=55785 RepID=A0AC35EWN5_9BILA
MSNNLEVDEIYTIEDLETYGQRLHYSTVITLMINIFTGYIVLKYSNKAMGNYKYYLFCTILTAGIMDFDATFIFGIYPTFPLAGFCGTGFVAKHLDYFWGEIIQYVR